MRMRILLYVLCSWQAIPLSPYDFLVHHSRHACCVTSPCGYKFLVARWRHFCHWHHAFCPPLQASRKHELVLSWTFAEWWVGHTHTHKKNRIPQEAVTVSHARECTKHDVCVQPKIVTEQTIKCDNCAWRWKEVLVTRHFCSHIWSLWLLSCNYTCSGQIFKVCNHFEGVMDNP